MNDADFAQRQLAFLQTGGLSRDAAVERLREQLPPAQIAAISHAQADALQRHLRGFERELGPHFAHIDGALTELRRDVAAAFRPIWRSYRAVAVHFALVTALAWVLFTTVGFFVMPQFEAIFGAYGGELPLATRMAMSPLPRTALLLILTLCSVGLFWLPSRIARTVELRNATGGTGLASLFLGRSVDEFWLLLELALARAASDSGMSATDALDFSRRFVDGWPPARAAAGAQRVEMHQQLAVAGRVGTLAAELSHQSYAFLSELPLRASARREQIGFAVNFLLGLVIAMLIVAVYLPIFKLAVVI